MTPGWLDALALDTNPRVRAAMLAVDRDRFLPESARTARDADRAVLLSAGQTISQPSLVAAMLSLLAVQPGQRVLDLGAGSGYVAALLAQLVGPHGRVIALERQGELYARARAVVPASVDLRHADGLRGAADAAPFDRIHVGCACTRVPQALVDQLATDGRLVLPVGPLSSDQMLTVIVRQGQTILTTIHDEVRFVPALPGTVADSGPQSAFEPGSPG